MILSTHVSIFSLHWFIFMCFFPSHLYSSSFFLFLIFRQFISNLTTNSLSHLFIYAIYFHDLFLFACNFPTTFFDHGLFFMFHLVQHMISIFFLTVFATLLFIIYSPHYSRNYTFTWVHRFSFVLFVLWTFLITFYPHYHIQSRVSFFL